MHCDFKLIEDYIKESEMADEYDKMNEVEKLLFCCKYSETMKFKLYLLNLSIKELKQAILGFTKMFKS